MTNSFDYVFDIASGMKKLCVFCGSNSGTRPAYREAAVRVGSLPAGRGMTLVYGGGKVGMMGALADACLAGNGKVIGIIPKSLAAKEIGHPNLTELRVVDSMHERKKMMADQADAFLALPGGFGTWEEFCEVQPVGHGFTPIVLVLVVVLVLEPVIWAWKRLAIENRIFWQSRVPAEEPPFEEEDDDEGRVRSASANS